MDVGEPYELPRVMEYSPQTCVEHYPCVHSALCVCVHTQEAFYGREVVLADRELVEQDPDAILGPATEGEVALLVVGDPLG